MKKQFVCLMTLHCDKCQMRLHGNYKINIRRLPTNKRESAYIHLWWRHGIAGGYILSG